MELINNTPFEAELIHGPSGSVDHGVVLIIKKTLPLSSQYSPTFIWPVSLQELKTDLAVFPFDHHFPIAKMDVMVCGYATAPSGRAVREMRVSLSIGDFHYEQDIIGDRFWRKRVMSYAMTDPEPFSKMPLTLENAFGGKSPLESGDIPCLDNPEGKGYLMKGANPDGVALPNIERPSSRIEMPFDLPEPTCMAPYPISGKLRYNSLIKDGKMKEFDGADSHLYFGHAHPDLMMDRLPPGTIINLNGMHSDGPQMVTIPAIDIEAVIDIDGETEPMEMTLDGLCVFAHENCFGLKYRAASTFVLEPRQERKVILREVSQ